MTATPEIVEPAASPEPVADTPVVDAPVVDAPVADTPPAEPVAEPDEPTQPLTKAEALQRMREGLARKRAEQEKAKEPESTPEPTDNPPAEPVADEPVATSEPAAEPTAEPTAEPVADPTPEPAPTPDPVAETPKYVVEISADHPIAGTVKGPLILPDEPTARAVKALLNGTYSRRKDVEVAQEGERAAQEQYLKLKTKIDAEREWRGSEAYQQKVEKYNSMRDLEERQELPKGTAQDFWDGILPEVGQKADQAYQTEVQKLDEQKAARLQQQWTDESWRRANELPEHIKSLPEFRSWFDNAVKNFNFSVREGEYNQHQGDPEGLHEAFKRYLGSTLVSKPEVMAAYKKMKEAGAVQQQTAAEKAAANERERARIEQEAIDRYKKQLAEERGTNPPPHPIANLGPASQDRVATSTVSDEPLTDQSAHDVKKASRERARARARGIGG